MTTDTPAMAPPIAAYLAGGPLGIVCSMRAHRAMVRRLARNPEDCP